jgi:hypothetical protein
MITHEPSRPSGDLHPLAALRQFVQSARVEGASERCAMCAIPIPSEHRHLVDTADRTIKCMCVHCHLLFSDTGAAGGRYRHIPTRHQQVAGFEVSNAEWDELQIPVSLAFFFRNSQQDRIVAFYPGPAGATESLLPLEPWSRIAARHPELDEIEDDVEAIIVRRTNERAEAYIVPIDKCYELTGRLRMHWSGFDGGTEAARAIDDFFDQLRERSDA